MLLPKATYSPWMDDEAFRKAYAAVEKSTLVDVYRCYELWQLVAESAKAGAGDLIEIGVWRGGSGALIAQRSLIDGQGGTVYLCDTFAGVPKAGASDSVYRGGEHADTDRGRVEGLIARLSLGNVRVLEGVFPNDTGETCQDRRFRFCHIDVDVYQSAKDVLEWVWPRLIIGGIVVFDDYGFHDCGGVTKLFNEQYGRRDRVLLHNLNGHGIAIKTRSE